MRCGALDAALAVHLIEMPGLDAVVIGAVRPAAFVPASSPLTRRKLPSLPDSNDVLPFFRFRRSVSPVRFDHFVRPYASYGFRPRQEVPAPEAMGVFRQTGAGGAKRCSSSWHW